MKKLKILDLFSGIGGFSLGLERAGMETVAFCEIEDYPVSILNKHWPDVPVFRDIRKLNGTQFRSKIDIVCGGFPCQSFSIAGKQKGKEDDRWLWPEMFRVIKESKPTWVIAENVTGFIKMALDDVLLDLENEGYTSQSFIIPACAVGGIHRRERVWVVAYSEHNGSLASEVRGSQQEAIRRSSEGQNETLKLEGVCLSGYVADSFNQGLQGNERLSANQNQNTGGSKGAHGAATKFRYDENRGGFQPIGIPTEPPVRRRDNGFPDNVARLKALGNAVVPQIPELIGRAIIEVTK